MQTTRLMDRENQSGMVLVTVVCFAALATVLAASLATDSIMHIRLARRQLAMEQSFFVAESGAEHAAAYINTGVFVAGWARLQGSNASGAFDANVFARNGSGARVNVANGRVGINPVAADSQFVLIKPDGTLITRWDLLNDTTVYTNEPCVLYSGPVTMILVRPQGSGNQITIDGTLTSMLSANVYRLFSAGMNVELRNPQRNPANGMVLNMEQWEVASVNGNDVVFDPDAASANQTLSEFTIISRAEVDGARRQVTMTGVRQQSWARFALWYDHSGGAIWVSGNEVFNGPVHANTPIYLRDTPVFNATVSSTANQWGPGSTLGGVTFNAGFQLGVPNQSMAAVNFSTLSATASLTLTGRTHIAMSGTNLLVTNPRSGWTNQVIDAPTNGLIYVRNAPTPSLNSTGTVYIGGTLDGRVTVVTEDSIRITNHVQYAEHPTNGSDDALGLIAQRDVVVATNAPNDLNIFAHIISCNPATSYNAGFHVQNYDSTKLGNRGVLSVYGGIVQDNRGAVGLVGNTAGYSKDYVYDQRFYDNPPPQYPTLDNQFQWLVWEEKSW